MANWRDTILKNFKPKISRLTLVADPDGLLTEEGMLSAIQDPDTIDKCLQLGAASFLKKPIKKTSPADLSRLSCTLEEAAAKVV